MCRISSLGRSGAWLCLLGSILALVAFFLPYFGTPPFSLWEVLLRPLRPEAADIDAMVKAVLALHLLRLCASFIIRLTVLLGPHRWNLQSWYLTLSSSALACYSLIALVGLYGILFEAAMGNGSPADLLRWVNLGAWLIPLGLVLALVGGLLLKRKEAKAGG
jgi:hypothetical protein